MSKDPIGLAGGLNGYQYAPNPVDWVDPLRLAKCRPCPKDCERILDEAGIQVGSHRDTQKAGGLYESHHIYQDAATSSLPKYGYFDTPAIVLQG
nr:hypothetical protein [Burkholderia cepacia]